VSKFVIFDRLLLRYHRDRFDCKLDATVSARTSAEKALQTYQDVTLKSGRGYVCGRPFSLFGIHAYLFNLNGVSSNLRIATLFNY
jgi:hypothetical protein